MRSLLSRQLIDSQRRLLFLKTACLCGQRKERGREGRGKRDGERGERGEERERERRERKERGKEGRGKREGEKREERERGRRERKEIGRGFGGQGEADACIQCTCIYNIVIHVQKKHVYIYLYNRIDCDETNSWCNMISGREHLPGGRLSAS